MTDADSIIETYLPLVTEMQADVVTLQMESLGQEALIATPGSEVFPKLRAAVS